MKDKKNILEVMDKEGLRKVISESSESTKFYVGSDSTRYKYHGVWVAEYATVIIVHKDGNKGGRIFRQRVRMRDYDQVKSKPFLRLMQEVYFTSEIYLEFADVLSDFHTEIHMDINPDEKHGSSCVVTQAIGYIRALCNIEPLIKPDAFAASFGADRVAAHKMAA